MKNFDNEDELMRYLADTRIACACKWDPASSGNFDWYEYPDYDEDEDMLVCQGAVWSNPVPVNDDVPHLFPAKLGTGEKDNILFFANISVDGEKSTPVSVFDAFDENDVPCSFAMFGWGDTSLAAPEDRVKLIEWTFEGIDDDDEVAWEHNICLVA